MCSSMIPNPSVASAKKTPDNRIAGIAMIRPTGIVTNPAATSANNQGTPWSVTRFPYVAAPTAANASWHSDTMPEVRTSSPSDKNSTMYITPSVHAASFVPTRSGTKASSTITMTAPGMLTRAGAVYATRGGGGGGGRRSASFARGVTSSATNKTMKGRLAGTFASHDTSEMYFVDSAAATPRTSPPRYVSGRLEK